MRTDGPGNFYDPVVAGGATHWLVDDESSERVENSSRSGRRTLLEAEFIDRVSLLL